MINSMEHLGLFCGFKPKHTTIFLLKVHGPMSACHIDPVVRKAPKKSLKLVGNGRTKDCTHVAWLAQPWSMFHRLGIWQAFRICLGNTCWTILRCKQMCGREMLWQQSGTKRCCWILVEKMQELLSDDPVWSLALQTTFTLRCTMISLDVFRSVTE